MCAHDKIERMRQLRNVHRQSDRNKYKEKTKSKMCFPKECLGCYVTTYTRQDSLCQGRETM